MTFPELQLQLAFNPCNRLNILDNASSTYCLIRYGYLFVDSKDGQCYLFDEDGQKDDISKVKIIDDWAFDNCTSLTTIKIPNSVELIGRSAFENCESLTTIKIPNSVELIGIEAFCNCESLTTIKIPDSAESIGDWAFEGCASLKEVVFEGKTMKQVKAMEDYPWGIKDESIIKAEK